MNQRALRSEDLDLILQLGEQVAPDAYLMTDRTTDDEIARRKREIQQLERLRGKKLIVEGRTIVTGYHANWRDQKRTLNEGRARA